MLKLLLFRNSIIPSLNARDLNYVSKYFILYVFDFMEKKILKYSVFIQTIFLFETSQSQEKTNMS